VRKANGNKLVRKKARKTGETNLSRNGSERVEKEKKISPNSGENIRYGVLPYSSLLMPRS